MSSAGRAGSSERLRHKTKGARRLVLSGSPCQSKSIRSFGSYVMATAEHREPYRIERFTYVSGSARRRNSSRYSDKTGVTAFQHGSLL